MKVRNRATVQVFRVPVNGGWQAFRSAGQGPNPNALGGVNGLQAKWQQQMQQQQATLQRLHGRLETVREIKEGMGIHSPRIEELAARKLRAQEPELASEWADMREAQRRHEALQRKEEQEKKQAQDRERREQIERTGRGVRLGLSQAR